MFCIVVHKAFEDNPVAVADIKVSEDNFRQGFEPVCELAFRLTQNVYGSWSKGPIIPHAYMDNGDYDPRITVLAPLPTDGDGNELGHRSSSVGDVIVVSDGYEVRSYEVEGCGFKQL